MNTVAIITAIGGLVGVFTADLPALLKLKALLESSSSSPVTVKIMQQWNADASSEDQATIAEIKAWAEKNNYKISL